MFTRMSGIEGVVKWGYREAARLGSWQFQAAVGNAGTLTAQVVDSDAFCLEQTPLVAIVPVGRADWRWSVTDLRLEGQALTASVRPLD